MLLFHLRGLVKTALVSTPSESRPINWTVAAGPPYSGSGESCARLFRFYGCPWSPSIGEPVSRCLLAWMVPLILGTVLALESRYSGRSWSSVTRDWAVLALILIAYWQVDWLGSVIDAGVLAAHVDRLGPIFAA